MSSRAHTVSFDFERKYTEDELLTLSIDAAKLLFVMGSKIDGIRNGGRTSYPTTMATVQAILEVMAEDMNEKVFDKAAKEQRDATA